MVAAGEDLIVVDARNPDFTQEPGDEKTNAFAPIAGTVRGARSLAVNIPFNRATKDMDLSLLPIRDKSSADGPTFFITHCGGGGRGQKAKDYLISQGYAAERILNGGGPEDSECWAEFGDK